MFVLNGCAQIVFPNSFTPNGDGLNETFRPITASIVSIEFHVYDRWGKLLYSGYDVNTGWNGEHDGEPAPVGTYAWYAKAVSNSGEPLLDKGNVTLLR